MIDILAIGAHPDDIEIFLGGAMGYFKKSGLKTAICDLTRGEAGTYGSSETRNKELEIASTILDLDFRETFDLPDGNIRNTEEARLKVINIIRKYRPEIIFSFITTPLRHPDHKQAGEIVQECLFLSGLEKIQTAYPSFRPSTLIQFPELITVGKPDFVVDITDHFQQKTDSIRAYGSQVTAIGENYDNTKTFLRSNRFWEILEARALMAGSLIGVRYGEPFFCSSPVKVTDLMSSFKRIEK